MIEKRRARRESRHAAHRVFDQLWLSGRYTRSHAYRWLQELTGSAHEVHIASLRHDDCERVLLEAGKLLAADSLDSFAQLERTRIPFGKYQGRQFRHVPICELERIGDEAIGSLGPRLRRYLDEVAERESERQENVHRYRIHRHRDQEEGEENKGRMDSRRQLAGQCDDDS